MFCCCDPVEQMRLKKYYSTERKCRCCKKITMLNPNLGLCPECSKNEIDKLYKKIDEMYKNKEEVGRIETKENRYLSNMKNTIVKRLDKLKKNKKENLKIDLVN